MDRYNLVDGVMVEADDGQWVKYEDHEMVLDDEKDEAYWNGFNTGVASDE